MMNLLNKRISTLLLAVLMVGCVNDDTDVAPTTTSTPTGITKVVLSSFEAAISGDGTIVTVTPLSVGADSYEVDFGDDMSSEDVLIISEQNGSVTYDYPNIFETKTYTITVTGISDGKEDSDIREVDLEVIHTVTALTSVATSPDVPGVDVASIFSDVYSAAIASNFDAGTAQYTELIVDETSNVIQYSRLQDGIDATISFGNPIIVADAFGAGQSADSLHIDLHSIHDIGINKVKISLGGKTYEQDLVSDEWTAFDIDLAAEEITTIDDIVFELGTGGTATDEATLNVDNIYLHRVSLSVPSFTFDDDNSDYSVTFTDASELATSYSWDFGDGSGTSTEANPTYVYTDDGEENTYTVTLTTTNSLDKTTSFSQDVTVGVIPTGPINPEIVKGDFERLNGDSSDDSNIRGAWSIANTEGSSNPFGTSSDGSCTDYDGVETGAKTRGAKWSSSQSAADTNGTVVAGNTRYAYQAVTLTPNTEYIFEYQYAIRTGGSETNSIVASILNGHYTDSSVAAASNALVKNIGTEAKGKFGDNSCSGATTVTLPFRSNAVGEVAIFIYAVTDVDAYVDNVKIYPAQ